MAYDETGLWIIYATLQNSLDIVISKLDEKVDFKVEYNLTLSRSDTRNTRNTPDQLAETVERECIYGVWRFICTEKGEFHLFRLSNSRQLFKYEEKYTSLNYIYNTHTDTFKYVDIPFTNKFEWNTMVDYNPNEKALYSWDKGHQVLYNVTFEPSDDF